MLDFRSEQASCVVLWSAVSYPVILLIGQIPLIIMESARALGLNQDKQTVQPGRDWLITENFAQCL